MDVKSIQFVDLDKVYNYKILKTLVIYKLCVMFPNERESFSLSESKPYPFRHLSPSWFTAGSARVAVQHGGPGGSVCGIHPKKAVKPFILVREQVRHSNFMKGLINQGPWQCRGRAMGLHGRVVYV